MLAILAACHKYFACGNKVLFCSVLAAGVGWLSLAGSGGGAPRAVAAVEVLWNSSRFAGGGLGLRSCLVVVVTAVGSGVEVIGPTAAAAAAAVSPPTGCCNTSAPDFTFIKASRYETLSTAATFSTLLTS